MQSILHRLRKQKKYEKNLPTMKKEHVAMRIQELHDRPQPSGFRADPLTHMDHMEQSQSISTFLATRFHDMYTSVSSPEAEHDNGDDDDDDAAARVSAMSLRAKDKPLARGKSMTLEPLKQLQLSSKQLISAKQRAQSSADIGPSTMAFKPPSLQDVAPVERKLPPLYYRLQPVWTSTWTCTATEEEVLGLPTAENARMVFGIDIYEAKGIVRMFHTETVESLYQLYTKERIYGREGQMRDNMTKAVFSTRTTTRVMSILKQIDSFSIFLDAKPKKDPIDESPLTDEPDGMCDVTPLPSSATDEARDRPSDPLTTPATDTTTSLPPKTPPPATARRKPSAVAPLEPPPPSKIDLIEIYLQHCAIQQVLPSKRVMAQLDGKVVDISHFNIGSDGVVAMVHALQWNAGLVEANLTDNWSQDDGGRELARLVLLCPQLTALNVSNNHIGTRSALVLLQAAVSSRLVRLHLRGNDLYDRVHGVVGQLLSQSHTLVEIDLGDNKVRNKTGAAIGAALLTNQTLESLDLTWNTMSSAGCMAILQALSTNATLTHLNLGWNRLGDDTGCAVAAMLLRNETLTLLNLASAQLSCVSVGFLADALTFNRGLRSLVMDQNPIDDAGIALLLQAAKKRARVAATLEISLDKMIYKHRDAHAPPLLPFDPLDPSGYYRLHLKEPTERTVFELLKIRQELQLGAIHHLVSNNVKVDARNPHRVAANAYVRFEFVAAAPPERSDLIHFRLDLTVAHDRAMAHALITRAKSEQGRCACVTLLDDVAPGENWKHETLDGVPFQLDEERTTGRAWLDAHPAGVLELDYVTTNLFCESHYKLNLEVKTDRAMAWKLLERVQRSHRVKRTSAGDEWRNLTLDRVPITLEAWEVGTTANEGGVVSSSSSSKWKWRVPLQGTIEFDFYTPHPHHVVAQHYRLNLAHEDDRITAHELRVRALECVGECWWNEEVDGYPFSMSESLDHEFDFPHKGTLEFDFILLRPAHFITNMLMDECRFDLAEYDGYLHAEFLRHVARTESQHYAWTDSVIDGRPWLKTNEMLPPTGILTFHGLIFLGKDPAPDTMVVFLSDQLKLHEDDFDRQKYLLNIACGAHDHTDYGFLSEDTGPMFFTSAMVSSLLHHVVSEKHQLEALQILWPTTLDKPHLAAECIARKSDVPAHAFGFLSFADMASAVLARFLTHRLHLETPSQRHTRQHA
ncbi:Aste57867_11650 [Aphanomyces stellatus]|uniref:Aste57867_11650 protein n=1 Tax=Aphanomyces stellatus TaxID=120398 RepID=A0A485KU16_9STRA|nr:hypothetical protein As57867_011607 [Aphanomyces stellatus]VFT88508.1 Aste57867_11650 [Aphanomyces stellatus]